jgi:hypothetical protein
MFYTKASLRESKPSDVKSQNVGKPTRVLLHFHGGGFIAGTLLRRGGVESERTKGRW